MRKSFTKEQLETKTKTFLEQQELEGVKPRHGLFSQPVSLAVGDTYYKAPTRKRNNKGEVPTGPKNFYSSKMKNGQSDQALFTAPKYNGINDPYDEPWKSLKLRSSTSKSGSRARPFTAGGNVKQRDPTSYLKHQLVQKENLREGPWQVKSRNPNFVTSKCKTGGGRTTPGVGIGGTTIKYTEDDFDREKDHKREVGRKHKEKIPRPFSSTVRQRTTFTKNKMCYSEEGLKLKPKKELYKYDPADHSGPFVPSNPPKKGHNKTIDPFPKYVEDPGKKIMQKSLDHYAKQTGYWKHPTHYRSKVCTSITENMRNQRQSYYSKFY
jgi:hypothetical protein